MRLRERVALRAPQRYGEGSLVTPSRPSDASNRDKNDASKPGETEASQPKPRTRIMPVSARPTFGPPPYIDYDPNSPPAAFPTIDGPRPGIGKEHNKAGQEVLGGVTQQGTKGMVDHYGTSVSGYSDEMDESGFPEVMEMSGDESDGLNDPYFDMAEYKIVYAPNIKWEDLSPILQTEIVRNLSHIYTSSRIATLLELDTKEQKDILEHSSLRKAQWEEENRKLYEMRDKQLRALLRIDNSVLKRSRVPGQLVFRNVSKRYIRNPLARADPDYFMIKASDLLAARRYLRRKGVNPRFAGEWKNDMAAIQRSVKGYEDEDLRWTLDLDDVNEQDTPTQTDTGSSLPDSTPPTSPQKSTTVSPQIRFINHFGGPKGTACEVPMYPKPDKDPNTPLNAARHILGRRKAHQKREKHPTVSTKPSNADDSIIRLSVGPEGAAQIQNLPKSKLPSPEPTATHDSHGTPPLPANLDMARDSPVQGELSVPQLIGRGKRRHSPSPTRETDQYNPDNDTEMPLEKVLGTKLWYKSGVMDSLSWRTNESQKNFTEKLRAVRDEKRAKTKTTAVGSLEGEGTLIIDHALPTHSSLKAQASTDLAASRIETQMQLPVLPPSAVDTPINEQSHAQNGTVTRMADSTYYNLPTLTIGDEEEHGPPYSPISTRSISEPNTERGKTPIEQDGDAEPMEIDSVSPTSDGGNPNLEDGVDAEERYYTPEEPEEAILTTEGSKEQVSEHEISALVDIKHEAEHESIENHDIGGPVRLNSETNYEPILDSPVDTPKTLEHNDKDDNYDSMSVDAEDQVHQTDGSPLSSWELVESDTKSVSATPEEGQPKKKGRNSRVRQSTPRRSERINPTPGRTLRARPANANGTK